MVTRTRKHVEDLSSDERKAFVAALKKMKATYDSTWGNVYDKFVGWHRELHDFKYQMKAGKNENGVQLYVNPGHQGPTFLPWHRIFLLEFEAALKAANGDKDLALPYWNWTKKGRGSILWEEDFLGGLGDLNDGNLVKKGNFAKDKWAVLEPDGKQGKGLRRDLWNDDELPLEGDIFELLKNKDYESPYDPNSRKRKRFFSSSWNETSDGFRRRLEGWPSVGKINHRFHNAIHGWVGGHMRDPRTAPNDPVFWLHHCFIDKLWFEWQKKYPNATYRPTSNDDPPPPRRYVDDDPSKALITGSGYDDRMWPFTKDDGLKLYRPSDVWDHTKLPYTYS